MAKVLLIKSSIQDEKYIQYNPPLGLMYIASTLKEAGNHDVKIIDLRFELKNINKVINEIKLYSPDIIGFSAFNQEADLVHRLSPIMKNEITSCKLIIVGGPYGTSLPDEVLNDDSINIAVIGEGESTMASIVSLVEQNNLSDIYSIDGIGFMKNNSVRLNKPVSFIENVDKLPFPDWDLIDISKYAIAPRLGNIRKNRYMPIFTSRACPYKCMYCHNIFGKGFRSRNPENVIEEMKILVHNYGIKEFEIIDDIFNLDYQRALNICELIIKNNLNVKIAFPNGLRCDLLDENLIKKLKEAGTYFLGISVETASPRMQQYIHKNLNLDKVKSTIDLAHKYKIFTVGYFMLGFPTETKPEMLQTINYACDSKLNYATFFSVSPFKGTELWEVCKDKIKLYKSGQFNDFHRKNYNFSTLDNDTFSKIKSRAYRQFYKKWYRRILFSGAYKIVRFDRVFRIFYDRAIKKL